MLHMQWKKQVDQKFTTVTSTSVKWKRPKYECQICSLILFERFAAKSHLMSQHPIIITKELDELRNRGKKFSEIQLEFNRLNLMCTRPKYCPPAVLRKVSKGSVANQMKCTFCHEKFGFWYNLSRHEALNHPEQFFVGC